MINIILILIILILLFFIFNKDSSLKENFDDHENNDLVQEEYDDMVCQNFCEDYVPPVIGENEIKCTIDFTPETESVYQLGKTILYKNDCVDDNNKCNSIQAYSPAVLYQKNPDTNLTYTAEERTNKINQYNNICQSKNGRKLTKCCDPDDRRLDKVINFLISG